MRLPPILAIAALAILVAGPTAAACHGTVTLLGVPNTCAGATCAMFYLVSSGGVGGQSVLALYQETNGIGGLQRGAPPTLQGGYDDCFVSGAKDLRVF